LYVGVVIFASVQPAIDDTGDAHDADVEEEAVNLCLTVGAEAPAILIVDVAECNLSAVTVFVVESIVLLVNVWVSDIPTIVEDGKIVTLTHFVPLYCNIIIRLELGDVIVQSDDRANCVCCHVGNAELPLEVKT